ncbi:neurofibromin, partial [Ehrlichia ruminantium]
IFKYSFTILYFLLDLLISNVVTVVKKQDINKNYRIIIHNAIAYNAFTQVLNELI